MFRGVWGGVGLVLVFLVGCTRNEDYYQVFREQHANYKEMADILATVKDAQTMADAKTALAEKAQKFEAIARKAKGLPSPPPPDVTRRLLEDKAILESNLRRLASEVQRVRKLDGGEAFLKQFDSDSPGLFSAVQP